MGRPLEDDCCERGSARWVELFGPEVNDTNGQAEGIRRVQELRRSNSAQPHRNRKTYTRKRKHRNRKA